MRRGQPGRVNPRDRSRRLFTPLKSEEPVVRAQDIRNPGRRRRRSRPALRRQYHTPPPATTKNNEVRPGCGAAAGTGPDLDAPGRTRPNRWQPRRPDHRPSRWLGRPGGELRPGNDNEPTTLTPKKTSPKGRPHYPPGTQRRHPSHCPLNCGTEPPPTAVDGDRRPGLLAEQSGWEQG